jgi:hypothetical protein
MANVLPKKSVCEDDGFKFCLNTNMKRCEDGICRINCPEYDGCPLAKPLKCPNGACVNYFRECSG